MLKLNKMILAILLSLTLSLTGFCAIDSDRPMTNAEFLHVLIGAMGAELPRGSENLSDSEYFEVLSNMLVSIGINDFRGLDPAENISCGKAVDVLYRLTGGSKRLSYDGKIAHLAGYGFKPFGEKGNACFSYAVGLETLNNMQLAKAVAEAYGPISPEFNRGFARTPGVRKESAASPVS